MSLRGSIFGVLAVGALAMASGCTDTYKEQNAALYKNNDDLTKQVESQKAQIAGLQDDLTSARTAAAGSGKSASTGTTSVVDDGSNISFNTAPGKAAGRAPAGGAAKRGSEVMEISADVLFDSGRSSIKPEAKKSLDALVAKLKSTAGSHFTIEGHTDNIPFKKGSTMTNEKLGLNRAQAVVTYLETHGIAKAKLTAVSKADKEPKSTTDQSKNRRVTVLVD